MFFRLLYEKSWKTQNCIIIFPIHLYTEGLKSFFPQKGRILGEKEMNGIRYPAFSFTALDTERG